MAKLVQVQIDGNKDPFDRKNGKTFLKFDSIVIRMAGDMEAAAVLCYKGEEIIEVKAPGVDFNRGDSMTLHGVVGKIEVTLK